MNVLDSNGLVRMKKKLQLLKNVIKVWIKEVRVRSKKMKNNIHQNLSEVDKIIDQGLGNDEVIHNRTNLLKDLQELNPLEATDISQKAKIRWTIEGDENTKYFQGMGVKQDEVEMAANLVGCSTFTSSFKYLGVKVGDNMSRLNSWDDVISKVSNRLSNWKLKTLSIGGRLTLIKSVLSLFQLYHMSIFKAPMGVLNKLESIRRNFFNGTDDSSLWSRFIKVMHDNHGALTSRVLSLRRSHWPPRGGIKEEQLTLLGLHITHISLPNMSDRWLWSLEACGSFSIKSTRIYIDENILPSVDAPTGWVKVIPIKRNLHPIFSSLVPWLDKFGAKLCVGGRWMLPLLFAMKIGLIGLATFDFLSI
nr:RNA-directed DNA polymerase, eukaryota, reverse transcriptase zinc-binding domain protein [Tanacetum cinerariifolium]